MDIGPREDGTIDERQEHVLTELGSWIDDNREAVYGTTKGLSYHQFLGGSTISADKQTDLVPYSISSELSCFRHHPSFSMT